DFHVTGVQTCALPICRSRPCKVGRQRTPIAELDFSFWTSASLLAKPRKTAAPLVSRRLRGCPRRIYTPAHREFDSKLGRPAKMKIGRASCRERVAERE